MNLQEEYGLRPAAPLRLRDYDVAILYPRDWKCEMNPLSYDVEALTGGWLKDLGLLDTPEGREKFKNHHSYANAGCTFPDADFGQLDALCRFFTLWIFYDDAIEGRGEGEEERVVDAVAGRLGDYRGDNPYHRGWWQLGRHFREIMSEGWLLRHGEKFRGWLRSLKEEARLAENYRSQGRLPTVEEQLKARGVNIGMIPTIDFLEYLRRRELPEDLLKHPEYPLLERLAAEVVAIMNELFSYTKDRKSIWCNLVTCAAEEFEISLEGAFQHVAGMHNDRILEMLSIESTLLSEVSDPAFLRRWLMGLHHILYGFAYSHSFATRYRSSHEVGNGRQVRILVQEV